MYRKIEANSQRIKVFFTQPEKSKSIFTQSGSRKKHRIHCKVGSIYLYQIFFLYIYWKLQLLCRALET